MLEKSLRWSSVSEIQGGIQGGRFEDVVMEIGPGAIYRHIFLHVCMYRFPVIQEWWRKWKRFFLVMTVLLIKLTV